MYTTYMQSIPENPRQSDCHVVHDSSAVLASVLGPRLGKALFFPLKRQRPQLLRHVQPISRRRLGLKFPGGGGRGGVGSTPAAPADPQHLVRRPPVISISFDGVPFGHLARARGS